jgi:hypothetical protein
MVNFEIPISLTGNILVHNGLYHISDFAYLAGIADGSDTGGDRVTNGTYNIPILFKFHI